MNEEAQLKPLLSDELEGQFFFLDEFGLCQFNGINVQKIILRDDERSGPFYIPSKTNKGSLERIPNPVSVAQIQEILKKSVYVLKKEQSMNYGYYGYGYGYAQPTATKDNTDAVRVASLQLLVQFSKCISCNEENVPTHMDFASIDLTIAKQSEIEERKCVPLGSHIKLTQVDIELLKEGDEIYLLGKGKASVAKLYGYPENEGPFCQLMLANGESRDIDIEGTGSLYYLPYKQHADEFAELSESKSELMLSPVLVKDRTRGIHTYYWREIPDAARYVVKLYAIVTVYHKKRLYRLTEIDLDRNTRYLVLPHIAGGFACKVIAEDREGNPIAISRASEDTNK